MAVRLETTIQRWSGLSTDIKPTSNVSIGSRFHETDTGKRYLYQVNDWVLDKTGPVSSLEFKGANDSQRRLAELQLVKPDLSMDTDGHYNYFQFR